MVPKTTGDAANPMRVAIADAAPMRYEVWRAWRVAFTLMLQALPTAQGIVKVEKLCVTSSCVTPAGASTSLTSRINKAVVIGIVGPPLGGSMRVA